MKILTCNLYIFLTGIWAQHLLPPILNLIILNQTPQGLAKSRHNCIFSGFRIYYFRFQLSNNTLVTIHIMRAVCILPQNFWHKLSKGRLFFNLYIVFIQIVNIHECTWRQWPLSFQFHASSKHCFDVFALLTSWITIQICLNYLTLSNWFPTVLL